MKFYLKVNRSMKTKRHDRNIVELLAPTHRLLTLNAMGPSSNICKTQGLVFLPQIDRRYLYFLDI